MPLTAPPVSAYLHMPWCVRKCPYCDFNSHATERIPEREYMHALLEDWRTERPRLNARMLDSVFFGGGTPSLFSVDAIGAALSALADGTLADGAEVSLEANPGATERSKLAGWRRVGVNRLSLGAQSFDDRALAALGRVHSAADTVDALACARAAAYDSINLDLMHGLPGQTVASALADLERAIAQAPEHISWYQLSIEPNTVFYRRPPQLPDDEAVFDMQRRGAELLAAHGYRQYEVSAFARGGHACRHNRNYWEFGDYLGIGAGAHGKLSQPGNGQITRSRKTRAPQDYMRGGPRQARYETCAAAELPLEFMMNALRLDAGCPASYFEQRTGLALSGLSSTLAALRDEGLLVARRDRLQATPLGRRHLDEVLLRFMPDSDPRERRSARGPERPPPRKVAWNQLESPAP